MHLILTFGFSISTKPNSNIENDKNAIKDKVKKKIIRQRKEKEISKDTSEITESSKNVIYVDQILAEIHVEYDLFPNYNFKFDCRCWEKATKVYHFFLIYNEKYYKNLYIYNIYFGLFDILVNKSCM